MREKVLYIAVADGRPIYMDRDGSNKWWLGGSRTTVYIPIFKDKKEARSLCARVKKERSDIVRWTKVLEVIIK